MSGFLFKNRCIKSSSFSLLVALKLKGVNYDDMVILYTIVQKYQNKCGA